MKPSEPEEPDGAKSSPVSVELHSAQYVSVPLHDLESLAEQVLSAENCSDRSISVLIEGDETVQELNRRYRGIDAPTDVLTFVSAEAAEHPVTFNADFGERAHAGDIIISLPAVRRNADTFNIGEEEELCRVLIHGVLHVCGWQHKSNDDDEPMLQRQEELLRSLVAGTAS